MRMQPPKEPSEVKVEDVVGRGSSLAGGPMESLLPSGVVYVGWHLEGMGASTSFYRAVQGVLGAWSPRSEGVLFSLNQPEAHAHPTQDPGFPL